LNAKDYIRKELSICTSRGYGILLADLSRFHNRPGVTRFPTFNMRAHVNSIAYCSNHINTKNDTTIDLSSDGKIIDLRYVLSLFYFLHFVKFFMSKSYKLRMFYSYFGKFIWSIYS